MTGQSPIIQKRKHDDADQRDKAKARPLVYGHLLSSTYSRATADLRFSRSGAGKLLIIRCGGFKHELEIAVHERMIERSSSVFQALIKEHRTGDNVVLGQVMRTELIMRGSAGLAQYVHFLYTSEIVRDEVGFVSDVLKALMDQWLLGLALRDVRYCNAIIDKLIETDAGGQDVLRAVDRVEIDPDPSGEGIGQPRLPLWKWLVEHIGATLSEDDIDCLSAGVGENLSKSFILALLKRVLQQFKGSKYRRAPTFANRETYHFTEDTIEEVWEEYNGDYW